MKEGINVGSIPKEEVEWDAMDFSICNFWLELGVFS